MNGRPFDYRMGNSFKEPLKRIYRDILPTEVVERKKMGFPVPLDKIFEVDSLPAGWDKWFEFNLDKIRR